MRTIDYCYRCLLVVGIAALGTGCATLKPKVSVSRFGEVDIQADKALSTNAQAITDTSDVKVVSGSMPAGLSLQEQSSTLAILPGYENKYSIIGEVDGDYIKAASSYFSMLWYPELGYEDKWRVNLCYPQAPINLISFGLWGALSPTAWACNRGAPSDESDRKAALLEVLKQGVKAAGGNLLIVTGGSDLKVTTMNGYGDHLGTSITPAIALQGFIVKAH